MQFQVPQFIEIEDKIIGPLTLKQFLYLAGAAAFSFILFFSLQTWLWAIVTVLLAGIAMAFAFVRINGQSFMRLVFSALKYYWLPKFYLWKRLPTAAAIPRITALPRPERKPLKDLWLKMTTSANPIEKREKGFSLFKKSDELLEKFEIFKKQAGDRELYQRVDYR